MELQRSVAFNNQLLHWDWDWDRDRNGLGVESESEHSRHADCQFAHCAVASLDLIYSAVVSQGAASAPWGHFSSDLSEYSACAATRGLSAAQS
jgi:hypothetical protein